MIPTVRLVFDRKKVATKKNKGLIQIEVLFKGKRKFMSTGIKVYKDQWDVRKWVVNSNDMYDVNDSLRQQVQSLEKWMRDSFGTKEPFTWEKLEQYIKRDAVSSDSFIAFVEGTIGKRNDIRESTRRAHRKLTAALVEYGAIEYFSDLTPARILDFDNWLHGRKVRKIGTDGIAHMQSMRQQSIFSYHKLMKTYINMAVRIGLMERNPYDGLKFKRGESEPDRYLNEAELGTLEAAPMRNGSLARAKDLFLFQCYTGLAYSDLVAFDFAKARDSGKGTFIYSGKRKKTGEAFYFIILPKAMAILEKYDYHLPIISIEGLNQLLKKVAKDAGIDKPLSTHWARRTAAMTFANHGVRLEVVAKILGHSSVSTTESFYASINEQTVADEMRKAEL